MSARIGLLVGLVAGLSLVATVSAEQNAVTIQGVVSDATHTTLLVTGTNFCAAPAVAMEGVPLSPYSSTPTQLLVPQPALPPGTYSLVVSCGPGNGSGKTVSFDVTIGSVGPKGDEGDRGDQGLPGADGKPGPTGPQGETGAQGATGPRGPTGPQGATGPQGPQGVQGPAGPASVSSVGTRRAATTAPDATLRFLSAPLPITVITGQIVIVSAQVALGTSSAAGASALRLWICFQQNGGALTQAHGIDWVQAAAAPNSVNVYPLTDTIAGLAGTYTVGMCGMVNSTNNWNMHDWSYTNVQVLPAGTTVN